MSTYLPGTTGERIGDLLNKARASGLTKTKLAEQVGVSPSTITRIVNGDTQTVNDELLSKIAEVFGVSVDFLTGKTDFPDKKNYEIGELGLTSAAAEALYTRKVNVDVVNRLLANDRFALVTTMIGQYLDETMAAGFAAMNQLYGSLNGMLLGLAKADPSKAEAAGRAMQEVEAQKLPVQSLDIERIKSAFAEVLEELKGETTSRAGKDAALTRETMDKMMKELTKGDLSVLPSVTPEQIAGAVMKAVDLTGYPPEKVEALRGGLNAFFSGDMRIPEVIENDAQAE